MIKIQSTSTIQKMDETVISCSLYTIYACPAMQGGRNSNNINE